MSLIQVIIIAGVAAITSFSGTAIINSYTAPFPTSTVIPTVAPSLTPELTSSPTPTVKTKPKNKPKPTAVPSPTPKPAPKYTSEQIYRLMDRFAGQYGVDANVLRHIAVCESGFDPGAENLSYAGLFQFSPNTWIKYRKIMGEQTDPDLRLDAEEAVQTAAYVLSVNQASIWPNCTP